MRKNLGKNLQILSLPVVIIGNYDKNNKPNSMIAAWEAKCDYDKIFVAMDRHKTADDLKFNQCLHCHLL